MQTEQQLTSDLLGYIAESLDVPADLQKEAATTYRELGKFLVVMDAQDRRRQPAVYAQGSSSIGTAVRPVVRADDFDVDLVYERPIARTSTTQEQLKEEARDRLEAYLAHLRQLGRQVPRLIPKARCWALEYPRWHMDVVPTIPEEPEDEHSTRLLISDRDQRAWLVTDPEGYRKWFLNRMATQFAEIREQLARSTGRAVEDVPTWEVKTMLQRGVQLLKRHRDVHFRDDGNLKPASIVLTTIAAGAYVGQGNIADVMVGFCAAARRIDRRQGVSNPVIPEENFVRRWEGEPELEQAFFGWVGKLERDLVVMRDTRGLQNVGAKLQEMFGAAKAAMERLGKAVADQRDAGSLRVTGAGTLGATGAAALAPHTFHGGAEV
jgi:hypothetical protein